MSKYESMNSALGKFSGKRGGSKDTLKYQIFPRHKFPRHAIYNYLTLFLATRTFIF